MLRTLHPGSVISVVTIATTSTTTPAPETVLKEQQLTVGADDVQDKPVENPKPFVERIEAQRWLTGVVSSRVRSGPVRSLCSCRLLAAGFWALAYG